MKEKTITLTSKEVWCIMGWYDIGTLNEDFDYHKGQDTRLYNKLQKFHGVMAKKGE